MVAAGGRVMNPWLALGLLVFLAIVSGLAIHYAAEANEQLPEFEGITEHDQQRAALARATRTGARS